MIISHVYRYVFVELPHTASTAISSELREHYGGEEILWKHAHKGDFLRRATEEEKSFLIFAGIRNPMDVVLTQYFKIKTNHGHFMTDPRFWRRNGGHIRNTDLRRYRFITSTEADFPAYFARFHKLPYDSWGSPSPNDFDVVLRYEHLQSDFSALLARLRVEQFRPLPKDNVTGEKRAEFWSYYPEGIRSRAAWVFGPYMRLWGYPFPLDWHVPEAPWHSRWLFSGLRLLRRRLVWRDNRLSRGIDLLRNHPWLER